jgi:UDP-MurNAc hydroxylase
MILTLVNHASIVVESLGVRLITDPWLEGKAFNNGWTLLSPRRLRYEDFATITHIWFSHEHPDHFVPSNLKRIPEEYRRRIRVLFHETRDKRVISLCKGLGFEIQELPEDKPVSLAQGFRLMSGRQDLLDSWMAVFAEGKTLLNMNDCVFPDRRDLVKVKKRVGTVDVLLAQFSYANWVGNPDDLATQRTNAERKLTYIRRQVQLFQPSWFIPFASFMYFSHAENFFMNQSANRIGDVYRFASQELRTPTVVLYPGDAWSVGEPRDSSSSIRNYEADLVRVLASTPDQSPSVSLTKLEQAAIAFLRQSRARNNWLLLRTLPPAIVRLRDLNIDVELSYRYGLRQVSGRQPDIITSSDSLMYCLSFDWGGNTLEINGRYEVPTRGKAQRFFRIFRVPQYNSAGKTVNLLLLGGKLIRGVRKAFRVRVLAVRQS